MKLADNEMTEHRYPYLNLDLISGDLNRGWKLSESTPLFQRRILLAGHHQEKTSQTKNCQIDKQVCLDTVDTSVKDVSIYFETKSEQNSLYGLRKNYFDFRFNMTKNVFIEMLMLICCYQLSKGERALDKRSLCLPAVTLAASRSLPMAADGTRVRSAALCRNSI